MEWNVKNALSRDVERQQLNKILKEIRDSIGTVTASSAITERIVTETRRQGSSTPSTPAPVNITVTLTGDVAGEGNGTSTIEIPVVVDRTIFVTQAPQDNTPYWRINYAWEAINPILRELNYLDGKGVPIYDNEAAEADSPWTIVSAYSLIADVLVAGTNINLVLDAIAETITINTNVLDYVFAAPSTTWTMNHNLGYRPSVQLVDAAFNVFGANIAHPSVNTTIVTMTVATAGSARLT